MLSLGGARWESVGSRGGGGVADDAEELEEGEARSDAGGEVFFDPDVALSYIDKKLQHVLGHYQKDFEGGVSAEKLGSKYGGYGSFLPTYQLSPQLHQSRSPHIAANTSTSRSPNQPSAERLDQNASMVPVESISRNNGSGAPSSSDLLKKERCSSTNDEEAAGSDSLDSSFNGSDSKSVKVWTKVCSNNELPTKTAAIYSGLGLDTSSSSSMGESPDRLGGLSPDFSSVPYESPRTILQVMTCFPVPGGFLLSPLHSNLLQLTGKVAPMLKKWGTHLDMENVPRAFEGHSQSSLLPGPIRGHVAKKMKPSSKKKMHVDTKTRNDKGDASVIVTKEDNAGMPASQEIISDMPASTTEVKGESQFAQEKTRNACISRPSQRNDDVRLKEQMDGNDLATDKTEVIEAEATKYTENSRDISQTCTLAPKGPPKVKMGKVDIGLEESDVYHYKSSSFDRKRKTKVKAEKKFEAAAVDCEYDENMNKEWGIGPFNDLRNVPVKVTFSSNRTGDGNFQTEVKRIHKECHVSAAAAYDLMDDNNCSQSSAAEMFRKNATELKSCHFEKKYKSHKDLDETLPNRCQGNMKRDLLEDRSSQGELGQKEEIMNTINENKSGLVTYESKNTEIRQGSGNFRRLGMSFKREKSNLRIDNQDGQNLVAKVVILPMKEGKEKVCPTSVKSDSLKLKAKLMRSSIENGVQPSTVKQAISNPSNTSPMKKDGSVVAFALKEARDLKHKANDLKNKGQELESTGLYFEAALKFLHVAFLLETPSFDSSIPGDVSQSMKMYSETAKLCIFCAHEYERCKKMAAAALAYKCVEVAYLKAAYYKHPSASKDQQELQAAAQIAPGESPSSSAPDIDNMNSHGLSKNSSTKGGNAPQVPGNHLPLAVNSQAQLLRLLAYTNYVNLAFDATRKSELMIASAAGSHERRESSDNGLSSVKTVLDLNFSNVNELLRLVRVSMESISS